MFAVYMHKNKINGKVYIGITSQKPSERRGKNGGNYKSSPHFYNSINKYGWDNFEHEILYEGLTKEESCSKEVELIKQYNAMDRRYGYNQTSGGEINFILSEEVRKKKSLSMMGNKNGLGKPCSEEKKKKISEAQKGMIFSDERIMKMSLAAKNRHVPCSEEKRMKLRESYPNKRRVYCFETDTIYKSVQECARELNLHATSVSRVCKGKAHTTGGFHLKYYDDVINAERLSP